ncbi:MAG: glycosyltransferase [Bacteroidales bacterium]|nr:glycosyltransferase [Bacteroidales bacterium]
MNGIVTRFRRFARKMLLKYWRTCWVDRVWKNEFGYKVDWKNPRDINEKIQWLMCYGDTSLWSDLSDKIKVKEFLESRGYGDLVIPTLGVWKRAKDIDYDALPERFVLKCNHDSGSTHIIDKKKGFDKEAINKDLDKHLKVKFGYVNGETYYNRIKSRILAEEYLEAKNEDFSSSAIDYKVWCFDGKPYSVWACYSRSAECAYVNIYDLDWNVHPEYSVFTDHYRNGEGKVPRPKTLDRMLEIAGDLSTGLPEVRVDFYEIDGRLYFGEMTFATLAGKINFYTPEYLKELGDHVKLPIK